MKRVVTAAMLVGLLAMTLGLGAAAAAPINNPHAAAFTLDCGGEEIDVIVARGNPAFVVDSTQRLIPHEFTFRLVIDGQLVFEETEGVGQGKKQGLQDRLVTCELEFELSPEDFTDEDREFLESMGIDLDEADVILAQLSVKVMMTPAKK